MAEVPTPPKPLTAEEQDAKMVEMNMPIIEAFNALDNRQKVFMLLRYIERFGALPSPPAPAETEAPAEIQEA